jgi:hypothetical protein
MSLMSKIADIHGDIQLLVHESKLPTLNDLLDKQTDFLFEQIAELEKEVIDQRLGYEAYAEDYENAALQITELEKEREWISVDDYLPKTTMSVLVTDGNKVGALTYVKYVNGTGKWTGNSEHITAWMLKPKSPRELKEQVK